MFVWAIGRGQVQEAVAVHIPGFSGVKRRAKGTMQAVSWRGAGPLR